MAMNQQELEQAIASGQINREEFQRYYNDYLPYERATSVARAGPIGGNGRDVAGIPAGLMKNPNLQFDIRQGYNGPQYVPIPGYAEENNLAFNPEYGATSVRQHGPNAAYNVNPDIASKGGTAYQWLQDQGIVDRPKGASMWGEIGDFGKRFVLPAALGYLGGNALMGTGPFAAGAGGLSGGSGTTQLAGGAGADTLGAGGSSVFGGVPAGTTAAASPFGTGAAGTGSTVFGGTAGASSAVNPFAAMAGPGTVAGGSGAAGAGTGGMFSWLTADNAKTAGKALLGAGGILPALEDYFSSRDATNTMERGTSEAARMADPFAPERSQYADALQQMMMNPQNFAQDPSYQWRVGQGQAALERSNAAKGYLGSGNMNIDLVKYGQNAGSQEYQNQYNRLAQLSGANTGSPATAGETYGQGMTSVANQNQQTSGSLGNVGRSIYDNWPALQKTFGSSA